MVAEVLLQQLLVLVVLLPNIGLCAAVGIVLWGLGGSFQAWQVVLSYLQIVVWISSGRIQCCCRCGADCKRTS